MATALPRPLADVEMDELVRVEDEFQRRARTARPWSITELITHTTAVHARFAHLRRYQQKEAS